MANRIKERDYAVFSVIRMAKDHARGVTMDYDGRVPEYYRQIAQDDGRKVFYFSDTTMKRVENMETSKLNAEDILPICHKAENRTGVVLASENYRRLCFGYSIGENQIIIGAYRNNKSAAHSNDPNSVVKSMWLGNIIISESGVEIIPSSLLSGINAMTKGANVKIDRIDAPVIKRILREVKRFPDAFSKEDKPGQVVFDAVTLSKDDRVPACKSEAMSHLYKYELLLTVLKMFLFLKTASVIQQTYISEDSGRTYDRSKKEEVRNYVLVDSTWDSDITVLNPFAVRGHFRHQPKKDDRGRWYRDLIYIDAFMKKGYHRRATKVLQEQTS